jgi:hypothetical protein
MKHTSKGFYVKHFPIGLFLLVITTLFFITNEIKAASPEGKYSYYSDGQTFNLELSTQRIAIRLHANQRGAFSSRAPSVISRTSGKYLGEDHPFQF